ncbi:MAG: helix-turn-helix domain-containing protein [Promethearchaeota archaeon]|jgi:ribosome-binding protein aMBF1 (putative translation factor)
MDQNWEPVKWYKEVKHRTHTKINQIESNDPLPPAKISHQLKLRIQQARVSNKLSKKQLAYKLNLQENLISDYENGKAIPNKNILNKLACMLQVKF